MIRSIRLLLLLSLLAAACASKDPSRELRVGELTAALADPNPSVQVPALLQLSELAGEAQSATPALLPLLKSKDRGVRRHAVLALGLVAPPDEAVPALRAALGDPDVEVRRQAAMSLGRLGAAAEAALPELEAFSKEADRCAAATTAIKNIRR